MKIQNNVSRFLEDLSSEQNIINKSELRLISHMITSQCWGFLFHKKPRDPEQSLQNFPFVVDYSIFEILNNSKINSDFV